MNSCDIPKIIAHRGNLNGKNESLENTIPYILEALNKGFDVEIDAWLIDGSIYLGHDAPKTIIDINFLKNNKLWVHAKNFEMLIYLNKLKDPEIHYFFHQEDDYTLTSKGYIWGHVRSQTFENCITVLPEQNLNSNIKNVYGICTDYPEKYEMIVKKTGMV